MRIYKTRADFNKLQSTQNPGIFPGTVCTITDEVTNPMYVFQKNVWNSLVVGNINPVTGRIEEIAVGDDVIELRNSSGSDGVVPAPAFVRSIGASTAVAAAMEAFSAAMPKGGRSNTPKVTEQGKIVLDSRNYTLEKPLVIDISNVTDTRFGLTIEGQGQAATLFTVSETANPALFRDPFGDGIWRAMFIRGSDSAKVAELRLRGFRVVSYAKQGGDGVTPLSDPCRWIDLRYAMDSLIDDVSVYSRTLTPVSNNQYGFSFEKCYYSKLNNLHVYGFNGATNLPSISGVDKARRCGVGFRLKDNNALTLVNPVVNGTHLGFHLIDEDGIVIVGGATENHNISFLFDGDSAGNRVVQHRVEYSQYSQIVPLEDQTAIAVFAEHTKDNLVEVSQTRACPSETPVIDYSITRSNVLTATDLPEKKAAVNLLSGAVWSNLSTITVAANTSDLPKAIAPEVTSVNELTSTGAYNGYAQPAPITVDPEWGRVTFRVLQKRVSGLGMLSAQLVSKPLSSNSAVYASSPQANISMANAASSGIALASSGHSWSGGLLTIKTKRPHGLQTGIRVQSGSSWGTLAAATNLYVSAVPDARTVVLSAAGAGSIADPGVITSPGNMTIPVDMLYWVSTKGISAGWQEFVSRVAIRVGCTAMTKDGNSKPVLTIGAALNLQTGSKIRLSGFADSRVNVDYTILAGDVSGNNLTLTGLAAMADLNVTATGHGIDDSVAHYGYVGLTEVTPEWRCVTTNTGQNIVHRVAGESLFPGSPRIF